MWTKTTSILLVVFLVNFSSGLDRWYKNNGIATLDCPLDDDPDDPTLLPFIGDCTKFMKCSYGLAYTLNCPRGLHWSKTYNRCESQIIAACDKNWTTKKPTTDGCAFQYKPHPTDCTKGIKCINGEEHEMICIAGSYWDKDINKCNFEINPTC